MAAWTAAGQPVAATRAAHRRPVGSGRVLDVRQAAEFAAGHLPGAAHVELGDLAARPAGLSGRPVVVMCGHGERAASAASLLERAGHADVAVLHRRPGGLGRRPHRAAPCRSTRDQPGRGTARSRCPACGWACGPTSAQFPLLVAVNALVGGMLGQERTVVPLLADQVFGLTALVSALTFILAFGAVKAVTNFFAGTLSDRYGRKPVLVAGWLVALPVPLLLIWAPSWGWVVAANVLLGRQPGPDLVHHRDHEDRPGRPGPPRPGHGAQRGRRVRRGRAHRAGHRLPRRRYGLRPAPFYLGIAYVALGLGLSTLAVRETRDHARLEAATHVGRRTTTCTAG